MEVVTMGDRKWRGWKTTKGNGKLIIKIKGRRKKVKKWRMKGRV